MGLFDWLSSILFGKPSGDVQRPKPRTFRRKTAVRLVRLRRKPTRSEKTGRVVESQPYRFAGIAQGQGRGTFLDLTYDGADSRLERLGLPIFRTPEQLAAHFELGAGQLAWLVHLGSRGFRPPGTREAHYSYHWMKKRSGGWRLIEAPKRMLKYVQHTILREILDRVPSHPAAHGFVAGRSIATNAQPHTAQRVVVKLDLLNFYPSVSYGRVVAIFRSLGYCREAALWLARLTTTAVPGDLTPPEGTSPTETWPYLRRHLPQGAPTSPALANLSAYSLDVRLSGLARSFGADYTRYADDLTFSGSQEFLQSLQVFLPLVNRIVSEERFRVHHRKRKVLRNNQRQTVTGVVVNERVNVSRKEYDRLKAILYNCVKHGAASQNRDGHSDFAAYLRGRIAYVSQLNGRRANRLNALFSQIRWGS